MCRTCAATIVTPLAGLFRKFIDSLLATYVKMDVPFKTKYPSLFSKPSMISFGITIQMIYVSPRLLKVPQLPLALLANWYKWNAAT
jgi:hypothetical protein